MLGKKAAEIRILEERNQELEAALPFAELAVEIGQRAAQCMQGSDVEGYFDQILQDVEAAARKRLLQQQFDELPPECGWPTWGQFCQWAFHLRGRRRFVRCRS